jgi:signal transduction histidine kinase
MDVLAERSRLARDLHDSVAADLNALEWRILRLAQRTPELREEMHAVANRAAESLQHLREVIRGARASLTTLDDLTASLRKIGGELAAQRMSFELHDETGGRIEVVGAQAQAALIATAREGLHNAIRHSRGGRIQLRLSAPDDKTLTLTVEDDGVGMAPDARSQRGGLQNLTVRAAEIGGAFSISSRPGSTCLTCRLPANA